MKNVNFLHVPSAQDHYQLEKALSYNRNYCNSIRKSVQRVKGLEAADVDNKACKEAFQQLLLNSPWTQKIALTICSANRVATF